MIGLSLRSAAKVCRAHLNLDSGGVSAIHCCSEIPANSAPRVRLNVLRTHIIRTSRCRGVSRQSDFYPRT
jgi:hypothetical protein